MIESPIYSADLRIVLAFIVVILGGVIVYLNRKLDTKDKKIEEILNARIQDAKDSRDTLIEPLELIGRQNKSILKKINGK